MRDTPLILLFGAVIILYLAILLIAADRGWLPVYATAEQGRAVRQRAPWDVRPTCKPRLQVGAGQPVQILHEFDHFGDANKMVGRPAP